MTNKHHVYLYNLFFILLLPSLSANILTDYRYNGIKNLQKKMDYQLTQRKYWDKELAALDTRFGYIESYKNLLICDKDNSTLSLYVKDKDTSYTLKKEYNAFTGKLQGDKVHEGDLKTPIGIYNITQKISKLDSFYGPLAFVTSYPNIYDKYLGKNGSGIWIHGLPTEQERDEFTKGCIAIDNPSIECLNRNIEIDKTVLIIHEKNIQKYVPKKTLATILAQLYDWRYAWLYNDTKTYLDFYDDKFIRFDGMEHDTFTIYKTRIFNKKEQKEIIFTNINVIPYPNNENLFKITFFETYKSNSFAFQGNKVLIVKLVNNRISIITEK